MFRLTMRWGAVVLVIGFLVSACAPSEEPIKNAASPIRVIAIESFLADIAQNVAGERIQIETLMPIGMDPHSFEPTPQDVRKIASSDGLIVNGAGFELFLNRLLENAGGNYQLIEASKGLTSRAVKSNEPHDEENSNDPHFWMDPTNAMQYAKNIRDGLTRIDPAGAAIYKANADAYIVKLNALDQRIRQQVIAIPKADRKLVTDHDTLGYFADRYGFEIVGMIVPSFSSVDSTPAKGLAELIDAIKATKTKAVFVEANANPQLADQIAQETGARVFTGLYTHSLSEPNGPAPTYIQMLEYDTQKIVEALK